MKLSEIHKKAISTGIDNDPRGKEIVSRELGQTRKKYEELKPKDKETFDTETLENPYSDSRVLFGSGDEDIKNIMVGIDVDTSELLLADRLRSNGRPIDLVMSHHPGGMAFGNLFSVMHMQSDILQLYGVPINIAEALMEGRAGEIERRLMPANHARTVDAARLLNLPYMCLHTAADNMVATFLQNLFDQKKPYLLEDITELLRDIPEYREAVKYNAGPKVLLGSDKRRAGKIFVDMTGGTEGSKEVFESLTLGGINTIVGMHFSEEHRKEADARHINVVIAGHISSDTLGMNLLLDRVIGAEEMTIIECSGFKRIART